MANTLERKLYVKTSEGRIRFEKWGNPDGQGYRCYSCGSGKVTGKVDLEKAYIGELYCKNFCGKCFYFGTDWDIRCKEHGNKPIQNVYRECEHYLNAKKVANELRSKIEEDKDFERFVSICNEKILTGHGGAYRYDDVEAFLGIFNK